MFLVKCTQNTLLERAQHTFSREHMTASSDELDTLRRSRNSTVVLTANGEVHTNEEAQAYVHDLNLFVTLQLLEKHLLFYRLENSAKTADIPMSGSAVKNHG